MHKVIQIKKLQYTKNTTLLLVGRFLRTASTLPKFIFHRKYHQQLKTKQFYFLSLSIILLFTYTSCLVIFVKKILISTFIFKHLLPLNQQTIINIIILPMDTKWQDIIKKRFYQESGELDLVKMDLREYHMPEVLKVCIGVIDIKELYLRENTIGAEGVKYLQAGKLLKLTVLYLENNGIGIEGAKYLATGNFFNLKKLNLYSNNIEAEGAKYLENGNFLNLRQLYLNKNKIGTEGAKYFGTGNLPNLRLLGLQNNNIGGEGVKYLVTAHLLHLEELSLEQNKIGAEGCKYLITDNFPHIKCLSLQNNSIQKPNKINIRKLLQQINILYPYL